MSRICVVHLARAANGLEPFQRFLASYKQSHLLPRQELIILFKGFENAPDLLESCHRLLADMPHRVLSVPDVGFDIEPYFEATRSLDTEYVCFLNSFSRILDPDWLAKMLPHGERKGVGIVGGTGSYLSYQSYYAQYKSEFLSNPPYNTPHGRIRFALVQQMYRRWFAPFPNPFIRTNGFLIRRDVMLRVRCPRIRRKTDAYRFESGVQGLTRQVQHIGLRPIVVGRDGVGYEVDAWPDSLTFMQGRQENLLIADNQTYHYENSDDAWRLRISRNSWGAQAAPAPHALPPAPSPLPLHAARASNSLPALGK